MAKTMLCSECALKHPRVYSTMDLVCGPRVKGIGYQWECRHCKATEPYTGPTLTIRVGKHRSGKPNVQELPKNRETRCPVCLSRCYGAPSSAGTRAFDYACSNPSCRWSSVTDDEMKGRDPMDGYPRDANTVINAVLAASGSKARVQGDGSPSLTKAELKTVELLADAFNSFTHLDEMHPSDAREFESAIHRAQNIVMSRVAVRAHPEVFTSGVLDAGAKKDIGPVAQKFFRDAYGMSAGTKMVVGKRHSWVNWALNKGLVHAQLDWGSGSTIEVELTGEGEAYIDSVALGRA